MSDVSYVYTSYTSNRTQPYLQYIKNNSTSYKRVKSNPIVSSMVAFPKNCRLRGQLCLFFMAPVAMVPWPGLRNGPMNIGNTTSDTSHRVRSSSRAPKAPKQNSSQAVGCLGGWTEGKSGSPPQKKKQPTEGKGMPTIILGWDFFIPSLFSRNRPVGDPPNIRNTQSSWPLCRISTFFLHMDPHIWSKFNTDLCANHNMPATCTTLNRWIIHTGLPVWG